MGKGRAGGGPVGRRPSTGQGLTIFVGLVLTLVVEAAILRARASLPVVAGLVLVVGVGIFGAFWLWANRKIRTESTGRARPETGREEAEAERRLRTLVEHLPAVVYEAGSGKTEWTRYVSPQTKAVLGYSPDAWADPDTWGKMIHPDDLQRVVDAIALSDETGQPFAEEYRMVTPDGRIHWFLDQASLEPADDDLNPFTWHGVMLDITERKDAEERVREAERKFRTLVEHVPSASFIDRAEAGSPRPVAPEYISPQIEAILGYPAEEWLRTDVDFWREHLHPDDFDRVNGAARLSDETGKPYKDDYRMIARDGRTVWIHEESVLVADDDGTPRFWQGVLSDVTERKQAEQVLIDAEEQFRTLVETIPAAVYLDEIVDGDPLKLKTIYISPRVEEMLGYPASRWLEEPDFWAEIIHPDDFDRVMEQGVASASGASYSVEYRLFAEGGRVVWVGEESVIVKDENGVLEYWLGAYVDITERKDAELHVREMEAKYRGLIETIPAVTYVDVADDTSTTGYATTFVNPQIERMLGYTPEQWMEDPELWLKIVHPDDAERVRAEDVRSTETCTPFNLEYRSIAADGRVVWMRDNAVAIDNEAGGPTMWQGVMFDVTDIKEAEQRIRESERRLAEAETLARIGSYERDVATGEIIASAQFYRLFGMDPGGPAMTYDRFLEMVHPQDRDRVAAEIRSALEGDAASFVVEHRVVLLDGTERIHYRQGKVTRDQSGEAVRVLGTVQDVTERVNAEEERRRGEELLRKTEAERAHLLEYLVDAQEKERGRIADDIHDDSIQKMTAVELRLGILKRGADDPKQILQIEQLSATVQAAISSLRHLLFDLLPRVLDTDGLNAAVTIYLRQMEEEGLASRLDDRLDTEPPTQTRTIAYRIAQEAIVNVRKHAEASTVDVVLESRDGGVFVRVADDGVGFSPNATEANGREEHLGLASMRERAEMAGGWWRASSAPGKGTVVEFWLPASVGSPADEAPIALSS